MAEKANPFRDALYDALGRRGVCWVRDFGGGRHAELYTREDRWLALLVQKTLSAQPWWNIPHYFEELHALEREHPAYLVVEVFQDDPQGGTVLTSGKVASSPSSPAEPTGGNRKGTRGACVNARHGVRRTSPAARSS